MSNYFQISTSRFILRNHKCKFSIINREADRFHDFIHNVIQSPLSHFSRPAATKPPIAPTSDSSMGTIILGVKLWNKFSQRVLAPNFAAISFDHFSPCFSKDNERAPFREAKTTRSTNQGVYLKIPSISG
jgi:hypothetical protein